MQAQKNLPAKRSTSAVKHRSASAPARGRARTYKARQGAPRRPSSRRQKQIDSRLQVLALAVAVFLALCAINLIGLTDYVEPQKTTEARAAYQVGDPKSFFDAIGPASETYADYGLYPSVILAQAALESDYGESQLSFDYNNFFGIKAHDHHRSVRLATTEYYDGAETVIHDYFCVYNSPEDCFTDYAELLSQNENYTEVIGASSPAAAARALQEAGYATDPNYASKLISIINEYNLTRYDPLERPEPQPTTTNDENHVSDS